MSEQIATRTVSQSRRQIKEGTMASLEESAQRLWLYTRGADVLKSDDATYAIINKALVRGTGTSKSVIKIILEFPVQHV